MSAYLDTSVLVAAITNEASRHRSQGWLTAAASPLYISPWCVTELASALSMKVRMGDLDTISRSTSETAFDRLRLRYLTMTPIAPRHFELATRFLHRHDLGLRSGDALHLAIAADLSVTLCTFDHRLANAAAAFGYAAVSP